VVIWVAAILLITAVALFVAAPLSDDVFGRENSDRSPAGQGDHEHSLAVQGLRDLEFDYAMGKLDPDDYRELRARLETRALATMGRFERSVPQSPLKAAMTSESIVAAGTVSVKFCQQCGTGTSAANNFCSNCGAALQVTAPSA
jgi:cytochrome c-type biogenesis protein CcmH/NrfG